MIEKRFNVFDVDGTVFLEDHKEGSYHIGEKENVDIPCLNDIADRLNTYADENEQLKKENRLLKGKLHRLRIEKGRMEEETECLSEETIEQFKKDLKDGKFIELTARPKVRKHPNDHISWKGDVE